jgi:hypothetical protein
LVLSGNRFNRCPVETVVEKEISQSILDAIEKTPGKLTFLAVAGLFGIEADLVLCGECDGLGF